MVDVGSIVGEEDFALISDNRVKMGAEDVTEMSSNDDDVVLLEIIRSGFALAASETESEGAFGEQVP